MRFYPTVRIVKRRRTARLDGMAVCIDQVEHAGLFLEVVVEDGESGRAAQDRLDTFARSLGVELERVTDTYDVLVRVGMAHTEPPRVGWRP